jgi:excisionase family DNA binding protein
MTRNAKLASPIFEPVLPEWVRDDYHRAQSAKSNNVCVPQPNLLTLAEAAAQLRISPRTLRRMVKAGDVTTIRIGRQLRFDRAILWREINILDACRE